MFQPVTKFLVAPFQNFLDLPLHIVWKWYNQINLRLSYNKTVFPNRQKVQNVAECLFLLKGEWSLFIERLSIARTLESLLLLASIEKSSKADELLQNEWCSFMANPFHSFSHKSRNSKVFPHFDFNGLVLP